MFVTYTSCGDFGYGYRNLDVTKAGTRVLFFSMTGTGNPMWVVFQGTLTVSYS